MNQITNKNIQEPDVVTKTRRILNIVQAILIGSRCVLVVINILGGLIAGKSVGKDIIQYIVEIGLISLLLNMIKNGYKRAAILPMIGGFLMLASSGRNLDLHNNEIISIVFCSYIIIVGVFQLISMGYILSSLKVEFYCQYVLYNNSIEKSQSK